jgi:hypothetical protein
LLGWRIHLRVLGRPMWPARFVTVDVTLSNNRILSVNRFLRWCMMWELTHRIIIIIFRGEIRSIISIPAGSQSHTHYLAVDNTSFRDKVCNPQPQPHYVFWFHVAYDKRIHVAKRDLLLHLHVCCSQADALRKKRFIFITITAVLLI